MGKDAFILRMAITTALAGQGMVVGLGYNNARLAGEAPAMDSWAYWAIHGFLIFTVIVAILLLGKTLAMESLRAFFRLRITVEALFVLSLTGALVGSLIATFTGAASVYYEVVVVVLLIYSMGKRMGKIHRERAQAAVQSMRRSFSHAWKVDSPTSTPVNTPVEKLRQGDLILIPPGEPVPAGGMIQEGSGYIRETAITGELVPVRKSVGDYIAAGCWSVDGRLTLKIEDDRQEGIFHNLLHTVENARQHPSRLQEQADRITRYFVPFVASVSAATFAYWFLTAAIWWEALFNSMAVLLVACPCALGLAMPVGLARGLYRISQFGIHSRSGRLLDGLATTDLIVFDKTGTLSEEALQLKDQIFVGPWKSQVEQLPSMIASLESHNHHPIARALQQIGSNDLPVSDYQMIPGKGIEGEVNGHFLQILEWDAFAPEIQQRFPQNESPEKNPDRRKTIAVCCDGKPAALFTFAESWRQDLHSTLDELKQSGIQYRILTGDRHFQSDAFPEGSVEAGLLPDEKCARIREWSHQHPQLIFVGDGVNDAAAMAEAPHSIAMENAASLTHATAHGWMVGNKLQPLVASIQYARSLRNRLYGNMRYALIYNIIGMGLAAAGKLHPVVAALIMVVSSAAVTWRAVKE